MFFMRLIQPSSSRSESYNSIFSYDFEVSSTGFTDPCLISWFHIAFCHEIQDILQTWTLILRSAWLTHLYLSVPAFLVLQVHIILERPCSVSICLALSHKQVTPSHFIFIPIETNFLQWLPASRFRGQHVWTLHPLFYLSPAPASLSF